MYSGTLGLKNIKLENNRTLRLDLFKAKKNRKYKGIYTKELDQEEHKFANFQHSLKKLKNRNIFSN